MQIGIVGLGKMGLNMALRLLQGGHEVIAHDLSAEKTNTLAEQGGCPAHSIVDLAGKLSPSRIIWIMLPAGQAVDDLIAQLILLLEPGDIVIDGGNSFYKDSIRRAQFLDEKNIEYLDIGVSGGIWGLTNGYCLMVGGKKKVFDHLEPIFKTLSPPEGYLYCGATGAGHFVKMVHNGIEYGMMQAYGEGFAILEASPYAAQIDYANIAHLWNQGSVIRSWLLELLEKALVNDPKLEKIKGVVDDSGEGRWFVQQALESGVGTPAIAMAMFGRFQSRKENAFENKVLAALRREFGGHPVINAKK